MLHNTQQPSGDVTTSPTINDLLRLANGTSTQSDMAQSMGIDPGKFSRNLSKWALAHLLELQGRVDEMQPLQSQLQTLEGNYNSNAVELRKLQLQLQKLQSEKDTIVDDYNLVKVELRKSQYELQEAQSELLAGEAGYNSTGIELQKLHSQLSKAQSELSEAKAKLQALETFKAGHKEWADMNILEKFLSGGWARLLVLGMLVFYEADVTRQLLIEKDIENPLVISFGVGLAFLVFASSRNIWGQIFIIGYSLFTSGCLFRIFSFDIGWVFLLAFPCIVAAVMKQR